MSDTAFRWPVRVYYEDTDAAGIVYYASFLKFMERARTEWLRSFGIDPSTLARRHGVLFAVARLSLRYRTPARLDDRLEVAVSVLRRGRVGLDMHQSVGRDDGAVLCDGQVRIACLDTGRMKPSPIPTFLLRELRLED